MNRDDLSICKINKILLLGGSQGAQDINELYHKMTVDEAFSDMEITISCGGKSFEEVKKSARKQDRVFDFIYDIYALEHYLYS